MPPTPILLTRSDAAGVLAVSLRHFERHVQPNLRIVRSGSARLVPVAELEKWAARQATLAGDTARA